MLLGSVSDPQIARRGSSACRRSRTASRSRAPSRAGRSSAQRTADAPGPRSPYRAPESAVTERQPSAPSSYSSSSQTRNPAASNRSIQACRCEHDLLRPKVAPPPRSAPSRADGRPRRAPGAARGAPRRALARRRPRRARTASCPGRRARASRSRSRRRTSASSNGSCRRSAVTLSRPGTSADARSTPTSRPAPSATSADEVRRLGEDVADVQ